MKKIRVLIADDKALIRDGIKAILSFEDDIEVVDTVANGMEAYDAFVKEKPDVVLMDIRMSKYDGVLATKKIIEYDPEAKVLILTTFSDDEYIFEALKNGAKGYLLKDVEVEDLVKAIKKVREGGVIIEPRVAEKLVYKFNKEEISKNEKKIRQIKTLVTNREFEVLRLVGEGLTNKEIAERLFISEGTARNYISSILSKLDIKERNKLVVYAIENVL